MTEATQSPRPPRGGWIQTFTGRAFYPLDPRVEDVDIIDIAHALSHQCRFAGHVSRFYSVAEHCVLMSRAVAPEYALWALLHDASEAYLVDVPRPVKGALVGYRDAEARVMAAICARFGLSPDMPDEVARADHRILTDEMRQAMCAPPMRWETETEPLGVALEFWFPGMAKRMFLERFAYLRSPHFVSRGTSGAEPIL